MYLRTKPNVPCDTRTIRQATGVPKRLIDFRRALSANPSVRRDVIKDPTTGKRRVFWTYISPTTAHNEAEVADCPPFSEWRPWKDRFDLRRLETDLKAGLYMLAHFATAPATGSTPSLKDVPMEVLYIGMSRNLNNRPLGDHPSGKQRYLDQHPEDRKMVNLFVSICSVYRMDCHDHRLQYNSPPILGSSCRLAVFVHPSEGSSREEKAY